MAYTSVIDHNYVSGCLPDTTPYKESPKLPTTSGSTRQEEIDSFFGIRPSQYTYQYLCQLHEKTKKSGKFTIAQMSTFLNISCSILSAQIFKIRRVKKSKRGEKLKKYMETIWNHEASIPIPKTDVKSNCELKIHNTKGHQDKIEKLHEMNTSLNVVETSENETLRREITKLKSDLNGKREQLSSLKIKHANYIKKHYSICRLLKSTKSQLEKKRKKYRELTFQKRNMERKNTGKTMGKFKEKIQRLEEDKVKATKTLSSLRKQLSITENTIKEFIDQKEFLLATNREESHLQKIQELKQRVDYLESELQDPVDTIVITQTEGNMYNADFQLCVRNLLSEGVGISHINNVLKHVATLCGKTIDKLPSSATIRRMITKEQL